MPALLVVEDDARFRRALEDMLAPQHTVHATPLGRVALKWIGAGIHFDAALVDLGLPDTDGVDLIRALQHARPSLPIIVLTVSDTSDRVLAALDAGARGYVLKERAPHEVEPAIAAALAGEVLLSPRAARHVIDARGAAASQVADAPVLLTASERRVLDELARGLSYAQIGLVLDISINTVRARIRTLFDKLGVASSTEAISVAARRGLIRWSL